MQDRCREIYDEYMIRFAAWDAFTRRALQRNADDQYEPDMSSSSLESKSVQKTFDPPETSEVEEDGEVTYPDAERFLADQNTSTFTQKGYTGLDSSTVREYNDSVRNPFRDFAEDFRDLFYKGL